MRAEVDDFDFDSYEDDVEKVLLGGEWLDVLWVELGYVEDERWFRMEVGDAEYIVCPASSIQAFGCWSHPSGAKKKETG